MWPFRNRDVERKAIHDLRLAIKELDERLESLQDKHERLRGKFYATRQLEPPPQESRPESKAEILKRMGYTR